MTHTVSGSESSIHSQSEGDILREFEADARRELPAAWVEAVARSDGATVDRIATGPAGERALTAMAKAGWLTPEWPRHLGGRDCSASDAAIVKRALRRWRIGDVRTAIGTAWIGPTILEWGAEAQCERWLPEIAAARELWCQLFSEPEAGSDLASLRTRAVRAGDSWILSGTKLWTSRANISRRGLLIARSDPTEPKHRGMSAFGLDLHTPGIEIRPITQMTGDAEFYEVHLDNVEVSDDDRIGQLGDGWAICRTALSFERIAGSGVGASPPGSVVGRSIDDLIDWLARRGTTDRVTRDRLVHEWMRGRLIELLNLRVAAGRATGRSAGPEGSVTKILQAEHTKRLQRLFVDLAGPTGAAWLPEDDWASYNTWAFLRVQAKTIAGGTSEVLRNQLAERVLGLPREPDPSRTLPWEQLARSTKSSSKMRS